MLDDQSFSLRSDQTIEDLYRSLVKAADEYDIEADMKAIKGNFEGVVGINPRRKYITLQS